MYKMKEPAKPRIPVLRVLMMLAALMILGVAATVWYVGFHNKGMNLNFDSDAVADGETRMWKVYYGGGPQVALAMDLLKLMREQFGLSYNTAIHVAEEVGAATVEFRSARTQEEYETKVLPPLIRGYTRLRAAVNGTWDAEQVARAELDWWVARRTPERSDPESVGKAIATEYTLVYAKDNAHIQQAGLMRAKAAHLRDLGGQGNTDWDTINTMLRESYRELSIGVKP